MGFWQEECEGRGAALTHTHDGRCDGSHRIDQCCFCGRSFFDRRAEPTGDIELPPVDVAARMRALGIMGAYLAYLNERQHQPQERDVEDTAAATVEHTDDTPVEPKMVTGNGPTGRPDGRGRGTLTGRQEDRLTAWSGWVRFLGGDHAAE